MNILHFKPADRMPAVHFGYWPELLTEWAELGKIPAELAVGNYDGSPKEAELDKLIGWDFNWYHCVGTNNGLSPAFESKVLEVLPDGYGFIRSANYLPGDNDVYVAPSQIRRFGLKTGDIIKGNIRVKTQGEKFSALQYVKTINGLSPEEASKRLAFEDMTPIFPDEKIRLEKPGASIAMRVMDLMCPVGNGQRGMIVSPPKAG